MRLYLTWDLISHMISWDTISHGTLSQIVLMSRVLIATWILATVAKFIIKISSKWEKERVQWKSKGKYRLSETRQVQNQCHSL